jgi:group I intron endonuclease
MTNTIKLVGIYKFTIINNTYIGSSSNLNRRIWEHKWRLSNNKHVNKHFQNLYNKYGLENLLVEILEICTIDNLLNKEQYYINLYKPNINKAPVSGTTLGLKLSKEQCLKRKLNNLGRKQSKETIAKRVNKIKGRKYSIEHRNNISKSRKGIKLSLEHKLKLIQNNKKKVASYTLENELIKIYDCSAYTKIDGYTPTNVTRCCKNKLKTHKGVIWRYYNEY